MNTNAIQITNNIKSALADFFSTSSYSSIMLLVDENTEEHCLPMVEDALPPHWLFRIPSGEEHKTLDMCQQIWEAMTEAQMDRKALLVNLGGGVIGDMGGFCAATYKRGIHFINIPTTLLAMVDANVGGKLGVDFNGYKNHIGVFKDPEKVFVDAEFLKTLSERELRSGFAEIIKHCLIKDAGKFEELIVKKWQENDWCNLVAHSVAIKSEVVAKDPTERGLRKILNFGHTVGHAIETKYLETDGKLLHGEAIAIGMICEAYLSSKLLGLDQGQLALASNYLIEIYGGREIPKEDFEDILENMAQDKKNEGGVIKMSLLGGIGECHYDIGVSQADIIDCLFYYNKAIIS